MAFPPLRRFAADRRLRGWIWLATLAFPIVACSEGRVASRDGAAALGSPKDGWPDARFLKNLPKDFRLPERDDQVGCRLLVEYGALFVARGGVTPPPLVVFPDKAAVARWQAKLATRQAKVAGIPIELQAPAMDAFLAAQTEARKRNLRIAPRGRDAARRDYQLTAELWLSRVLPGLDHWVHQGRLSQEEAARIRTLSPREQVPEILRLEKQGLFFSQDVSKPILYSVAPAGSSQHLSLLALDVKEHENPAVRAILARHGWFQTIISDLPHFTYLGVKEQELSSLGLRTVASGRRSFWVPDIAPCKMAASK